MAHLRAYDFCGFFTELNPCKVSEQIPGDEFRASVYVHVCGSGDITEKRWLLMLDTALVLW